MDKGTLILLVDESASGIDSIRRVLADRAHHFRVQRVEDVPTALARILGGGVDIVLLNLPAAQSPESERLLPFIELRNQTQAAPMLVPIVVVITSGTVTCFLVAYRSADVFAVALAVWSVAGIVSLAAITGGVALIGRLAQLNAGAEEDVPSNPLED